jgi:hypothetical protein
MHKLKVEINSSQVKENPILVNDNACIFITPAINEDYWALRCKVSNKQAIVVFPKFGTFGCGFSKEKNWNTNLPIACQEEEIWNHIKHNRAGANIEICKKALHLLREAAKNYGLVNPEFEDRLRKTKGLTINPTELGAPYRIIKIHKEINSSPSWWIAELMDGAHLEIEYEGGELTIEYFYPREDHLSYRDYDNIVFSLRWDKGSYMECEEVIKFTSPFIDWSNVNIEELKKQDRR